MFDTETERTKYYRNAFGEEIADPNDETGMTMLTNPWDAGEYPTAGALMDVYGDQGDDEIWLGSSYTDKQRAFGGSGDDKIYNGVSNTGDVYIYGGSGKDELRNDWFYSRDETKYGTGDVHIYGDYKYGEDALDKDLWGDDDVIYGGYDNEAYGLTIKAGDGDDIVHTGYKWDTANVHGQNGNDTIYLPQGIATGFYGYGGDGNDTFERTATYGEVDDDTFDLNYAEYIFGGAGNDIIRGTHKVEDVNRLYGGEGEDKIYGGDYGMDPRVAGGAGDDWIDGGDNQQGTEVIYGDSADFVNDWSDYKSSYGAENPRYYQTNTGNDVIYGGDNGAGDSYIHGGYGDDKLIGGHGLTGDYGYIWGDSGFSVWDSFTSDADYADLPAYGLDQNTINKYGLPNDGDDLIDLGDSPDIVTGLYGYG